ncbi:type II toxin-antitoxin system RelE/ParE family toxin [Lutispora sp.]|uniref:type II toxin-antitoxin system RelE/ParE family toxin n=1 Tax=Lutispora sp. TaxID=2828727 RepID=UPI002B1FCE0F|nr:type II toxin-antitoxin system RelE/ParE family toxin [Lutispora sp.]MEA4964028.1 type II toxin-antitoxin system RelE/ParE family toxin [Lutispora sp.]
MVKWSKTAMDDLRRIYNYISEDSVIYAKKVVEEIINKSDYLKTYPNIGRSIPELNNPRIRELIVYSYRMVYQVESEDVEILTLVHSKKNLDLEIK